LQDTQFLKRNHKWIQETIYKVSVISRQVLHAILELLTKTVQPRLKETKYNVQILLKPKGAYLLNSLNHTLLWSGAINKEVTCLIKYKVFHLVAKIPLGYKFIKLNAIYNVKVHLRQKCQIVALGQVIDPARLATESTTVDMLSVRLLFLVTLKLCFSMLTLQKKYGHNLELNFCDLERCLPLIIKALYRLRSSSCN